MKCRNLFSGKNKRTISICRLLQILPGMLTDKCIICMLCLRLFTDISSRGRHPVAGYRAIRRLNLFCNEAWLFNKIAF